MYVRHQLCIMHFAFCIKKGYGSAAVWVCYFQGVVNLVKGISRQVIVVHSPDQRLFEQAIFILKEEALKEEGVTDDALLREAKRLIRQGSFREPKDKWGPVWAMGGAFFTGLVWLLTSVLH